MRVFTAGHELAVVPLLVVSFAIVFRALSASGSGVPDARRVSVPRTGTWGSSAFGFPPEAPGRGDRAGPVPGPNEILSSGNQMRGVQSTRMPNETTKHHNDEAHCGSVSRVEAACQRLALPTSPTPCGLPRA